MLAFHKLYLLILLFCRGRLNHGRHFTFHSSINDMAITFVSSNVTGSITDNEHRFAASGAWLQVSSEKLFLPQLLLISQWLANLPLLIRVQTMLSSRQCVTQCLFQLGFYKNIFFDVDIVVKNKSKCGLVCFVLLSTIRVITVVKFVMSSLGYASWVHNILTIVMMHIIGDKSVDHAKPHLIC